MAEAFIDVNVQLAFVSQRVGKIIPQVSLAFFIGFSLATGSLAETAAVALKKTIVFLGDSITAGYGLAKGDAYPAPIQKKIEEAGLPYEVEKAGLSGDTTARTLRRIDRHLQRRLPPGRRSSPRRCGRDCSHCCTRNELLGDARFQSFNVEMLEEPS